MIVHTQKNDEASLSDEARKFKIFKKEQGYLDGDIAELRSLDGLTKYISVEGGKLHNQNYIQCAFHTGPKLLRPEELGVVQPEVVYTRTYKLVEWTECGNRIDSFDVVSGKPYRRFHYIYMEEPTEIAKINAQEKTIDGLMNCLVVVEKELHELNRKYNIVNTDCYIYRNLYIELCDDYFISKYNKYKLKLWAVKEKIRFRALQFWWRMKK
jgi:hypothetical protein